MRAREARFADCPLEVREVHERVEMVRLPQVFLREVDRANSVHEARDPVDEPEPEREARVLPHVTVDEQLPARLEHA